MTYLTRNGDGIEVKKNLYQKIFIRLYQPPFFMFYQSLFISSISYDRFILDLLRLIISGLPNYLVRQNNQDSYGSD